VAPGEGALSARTVLEVADGLRWSDPRLGLSLAEHAVRLAGDDAPARAAAQRCVIRSLAEVDRFEEVVARATPLLEDAAMRKDRDDLAGLLVELAAAAVGFGDDAVAARLVAPVAAGQDLPTRTTVQAALVRAQLAGATGDVSGADRAAQDADAALRETPEPEAGLVRRDLARARAVARSRSGDVASALPIVSGVVSADPVADPDGGRRSLLATADHVDLLLDIGRPDEALERGSAALPAAAEPPVVRPAARVRLALAERVHLPRGAHDEARSLARTAAEQLEDAGHDAAAARAWEVVASAAERGGDLGAALAAVRHGHALESRSRERRDPALRALATLAASAPELPARPAPVPTAPVPTAPVPTTPAPTAPTPGAAVEPAAPEPVAPEPAAPEPASAPGPLSAVESLLADARSSVGEGPAPAVDGPESPGRRRGHRRQHTDDASRSPGTESVPETLARLLGDHGVTPHPGAGPAATADRGEGGEPSWLGTDDHVPNARPAEADEPSASSATRRRSGGSRDDQHAETPVAGEADAAGHPRSDAFSTAPGWGRTDGHAEAGRFGPATESSRPESVTPAADRVDGARWDPGEFPDIDPADPLGSATSREAPGRPDDRAAVVGRDRAPGEDPRREADPPAPGSRGGGQGVGTSRGDDAGRDAFSRGAVPGSPPPRPEERDVPGADAVRGVSWAGPSAAPRYEPEGGDRQELDEELALTRAGLLAEYGPPDVPQPPDQGDMRPPDIAVPSARRHVSGSMPLPATDQRFAPRPGSVPERTAPAPDDAVAGGRAPRGENGARLANLLAEAMDAFRHTGPEENGWGSADPARGNGDPARGNGDAARGNGDLARGNGDLDRGNGDRGPDDEVRGRGDGPRGPGIGARRA
jgi:hypothetical protein